MIDMNCYYYCAGMCLKGLEGEECNPILCSARARWEEKIVEPIPAIENLRLKLTAQALVDAVERYTKQQCLRSELLLKKDALKKLVGK